MLAARFAKLKLESNGNTVSILVSAPFSFLPRDPNVGASLFAVTLPKIDAVGPAFPPTLPNVGVPPNLPSSAPDDCKPNVGVDVAEAAAFPPKIAPEEPKMLPVVVAVAVGVLNKLPEVILPAGLPNTEDAVVEPNEKRSKTPGLALSAALVFGVAFPLATNEKFLNAVSSVLLNANKPLFSGPSPFCFPSKMLGFTSNSFSVSDLFRSVGVPFWSPAPKMLVVDVPNGEIVLGGVSNAEFGVEKDELPCEVVNTPTGVPKIVLPVVVFVVVAVSALLKYSSSFLH